MTDATDTQPDQPPPDQPHPTRIGALLFVVRTMLEYGRHLADTAVQRAKQPSFASIAVYFGTADLPLILARIERGILRATALLRRLEHHLANGRDVAWVSPRRPPRQPRPAATPGAPRTAHPAPSPWDDLTYPLTLEEIERHVRRRPIGRTIVDICLDLAVMPGLCDRLFGCELFDAINGHRGSIQKWLLERARRYKSFALERNRQPFNGWWDWRDDTHERIRGVLGFKIGQPPTLPADLLPVPT